MDTHKYISLHEVSFEYVGPWSLTGWEAQFNVEYFHVTELNLAILCLFKCIDWITNKPSVQLSISLCFHSKDAYS